ncbi:MAG: MCE family protein [Gammaproteobacteria bacterium]|nr:MCE family protein [Gammaproteobacteria bacterium]
MESRANYVATGAFVLFVLAGIMVATLWLARAQLNTQYARYEIRVSASVSGLDTGAPVRLNGIDVGRVVSIQQDPQNPQGAVVLLEIRQDATIRADSAASLEMQGLTGGRYVEISGGTLGSPKLTATAGQRYPAIAWRSSPLDALFETAPELMQRLNVIADRLQAVLDDRNRRTITDTLVHMSEFTATLDQRSQDLDRLFGDGSIALHNLARASATLNAMLEHFQGAPANVDQLIASANLTFVRATKLANDLDDVVRTSRPGLHELTTTVPAHLDALLTMAGRLTTSLDRVSTELERDPSSILFGVRQEGYRPR